MSDQIVWERAADCPVDVEVVGAVMRDGSTVDAPLALVIGDDLLVEGTAAALLDLLDTARAALLEYVPTCRACGCPVTEGRHR